MGDGAEAAPDERPGTTGGVAVALTGGAIGAVVVVGAVVRLELLVDGVAVDGEDKLTVAPDS